MVRNWLWLVDPGIKMFSGGQSKGHLQNQGDSILFLIHEVFYCPIRSCDHIGFKSQRGCRKHVKKIHGWQIYFDSKPNICNRDKGIYSDEDQEPLRPYQNLASYPTEYRLRVQFVEWLKSTGGGGITASQAEQDASRAFKLLRYC